MDIYDISIDNKTKFLTVVHDRTLVTKSAKILALPDTVYPGTQPVHQDLLDVMQLLVPHMVLIVQVPGYKLPKPDYLTDKKALTDEKLNGYYVNGLTIHKKSGMVTIKGGIRAENGKVTPLNAHTHVNPDTTTYPYVDNLNNLIEEAKEQAMMYFLDGKFGEGAQPDLFVQETEKAAE